MSERLIPVPESFVRHLVSTLDRQGLAKNAESLRACLPEPEPTFTDEEALAFYRAMWPNHDVVLNYEATHTGRICLNKLAKAGWTAPKALCPPPSPALVKLVEAARVYVLTYESNRLRAAVAAYDEEG